MGGRFYWPGLEKNVTKMYERIKGRDIIVLDFSIVLLKEVLKISSRMRSGIVLLKRSP
jgi:hypothetical protein